MAEPQSPEPVLYFVAVLYHERFKLALVQTPLDEAFGKTSSTGAPLLFDCTDYYRAEMGSPLYRQLFALTDLRSPEDLAQLKLQCNKLETQLAAEGKRTVNLDIGYLDHHKIVLASAKGAGQKIYLQNGIYADFAARWHNGCYQPFAWSFPDFKDGRYNESFLLLRQVYLTKIKTWRKSGITHR